MTLFLLKALDILIWIIALSCYSRIVDIIERMGDETANFDTFSREKKQEYLHSFKSKRNANLIAIFLNVILSLICAYIIYTYFPIDDRQLGPRAGP
tara:strand:- start:102 stop:389 length:288 start_codon:yes stop_codon:yes gene_type:complete